MCFLNSIQIGKVAERFNDQLYKSKKYKSVQENKTFKKTYRSRYNICINFTIDQHKFVFDQRHCPVNLR